MTQQEQFLSEHNKLSPLKLKATFALLTRFKAEKPALFQGEEWPVEKLRRPFLLWMTSLPAARNDKPSRTTVSRNSGYNVLTCR
jgi:hypothetical protein